MLNHKIFPFKSHHELQRPRANTVDFTNGPLLRQIVFFAIPLFSSMLLQLVADLASAKV